MEKYWNGSISKRHSFLTLLFVPALQTMLWGLTHLSLGLTPALTLPAVSQEGKC